MKICSKNKLIRCGALLLLLVFLTGTKACQESYSMGGQSDGVDDGTIKIRTPTATPTEGAVGTATPVATATATALATGRATATITPTPTETFDESSELLIIKRSLKSRLVYLENRPPVNWHGSAFNDQRRDVDHDGFSDQLEERFQTDSRDAGSVPQKLRSDLGDRLTQVDDDYDGILNREELRLGIDGSVADTDGDGSTDGAEVLSGTDPSDPESRSVDSDGDGLSDIFEKEYNLAVDSIDTDGDGVRDDLELALQLDPFSKDSDQDGATDGAELKIGADPLVAE